MARTPRLQVGDIVAMKDAPSYVPPWGVVETISLHGDMIGVRWRGTATAHRSPAKVLKRRGPPARVIEYMPRRPSGLFGPSQFHRCSGELTADEALERFGLKGSRYYVAWYYEGDRAGMEAIYRPEGA